jgi:F0F1-type ATP synthase membrane subunit b/b'
MKRRIEKLVGYMQTFSRIEPRVVSTGRLAAKPSLTVGLLSPLAVGLLPFVLLIPSMVVGQKRPATAKPRKKINQPKTVDALARLREEFVKATNEYKANLEKLRASYEKSVRKAEERLIQSKELFAQGLISRNDVDAGERAVAEAKGKVTEVNQRMATADTQIAETLLEAETEKKLAKSRPIRKGGMISNASFIRYNGGTAWLLTDAWKVQRFFLEAFKKPLPIAVFGQGSIHDRWRLDHRNAMDVSLHPDGPEGQALLNFLRNNGIPFLAFREAIPGTATGPHVHIGRPSHRY